MRVEPNYISHIVLISSLDKSLLKSQSLLKYWSISGIVELHFEDYVKSQLIAPTFSIIYNRNPDNYYILEKTHYQESPLLVKVLYEFYLDMINFLANNLYDVELHLFFRGKEIDLTKAEIEMRNYQSESMVTVCKYITNYTDLQNKSKAYNTIYNLILEVNKLNE